MTLREQLLAAALAEYSTLSAALAAAREAEAWCAGGGAIEPASATIATEPAAAESEQAAETEPPSAAEAPCGARPANGVVADAVLEALRAAGAPQTVRQVAERVGRNTDAVRTILGRLLASGRVARDLALWRLADAEEGASPAAAPAPAAAPLPPSVAELEILRVMRAGAWLSPAEIGQGVDRSRAYLYALLQSLRSSGRIEATGATSTRRYRILPAGLQALAALPPAAPVPTAAPVKPAARRRVARETPLPAEDLNAGRLPGDPEPGRPAPQEDPSEEERQHRRAAALAIPPARLLKLGGAHGAD